METKGRRTAGRFVFILIVIQFFFVIAADTVDHPGCDGLVNKRSQNLPAAAKE